MKRLLSILLLLITPLLSGGLQWLQSYDQAIAKAQKEHKAIMVFVEAEHCPYCERMREEVLDKAYMPNALKHFVPLMLDINSADAKKYFPQTYVTPSTYFVSPDKKIFEEMIGYTNEEFFLWRIDAAENEAKKLGLFK